MAALFLLGLNLISTELLPVLHRGYKTKSAEHKLEADSGTDVSTGLIYVWFFLNDGESLSVACDSSLTSKQRDRHAKTTARGEGGEGAAFREISLKHLDF